MPSPNSNSVREAKPIVDIRGVNEYGQSEADADHMKSRIGVKIQELYEQNLKVSKVKVALDAYASVYQIDDPEESAKVVYGIQNSGDEKSLDVPYSPG